MKTITNVKGEQKQVYECFDCKHYDEEKDFCKFHWMTRKGMDVKTCVDIQRWPDRFLKSTR